MRFILSTSSVDKPTVITFWAQLGAMGAEVLIDEWGLDAGGRITRATRDDVDRYDILLLAWSTYACGSLWASGEYRAAVEKLVGSPNRKVILLRLDDANVPTLFDEAKRVDFREVGESAVHGLRPVPGPRKRILSTSRAIKRFLEEGGLGVADFPGYGTTQGCPRCGAGPDQIEGWHDPFRMYQGVKCNACDWNDGEELILA